MQIFYPKRGPRACELPPHAATITVIVLNTSETPRNFSNLRQAVPKLLSLSSLTTPPFRTILAQKQRKICTCRPAIGNG